MTERTVKALNNVGLGQLRSYLDRLREGHGDEPPYDLLEQAHAVSELSVEVPIRADTFANRWDLGRYVCEVLSPLPGKEIERNKGLWAWLSLFFFEQVCPVGRDGTRRPGRDYRHIPDFGYRHRHQHLVYGPYSVYRRHADASLLLLSGPLHTESMVYHQIASRQDLIANKGVVEAARLLYIDEERGMPKPGCQDPKGGPGTVRRFVRVLQQLDVTYDVYGMSGEDIVGLLPREFDIWRGERGSALDPEVSSSA